MSKPDTTTDPWETLYQADADSHTSRMPVRGGWLYRAIETWYDDDDDTATGSVALCFVADAKEHDGARRVL